MIVERLHMKSPQKWIQFPLQMLPNFHIIPAQLSRRCIYSHRSHLM